MTLAKVILLTRDETDLIDDFLAYWGGLFDPENVIVVDNGSTHPRVLETYDRHVAKGGTVIVDRRPFNEAVGFMTEHMKAIADSGSCEWIFPIETDEFVFFHPFLGRGETRPLSNEIREAVHQQLNDVPSSVGVLKYGYFWGSSVDPADDAYVRGSYKRPATDMTRFYDQGWDKLIVRSSAFEAMMQWCHHAACKPGYVIGQSRHLGLLHFHDAGKKRAVERSIPVVEGYGYVRVKDRTLSDQLRDAARLRGLSLSCGHKLGYLDSHLRRLATLRSFRRYLGRLPCSLEEMLEVSEHPDVLSNEATIDGLVKRMEGGGKAAATAWDDLLYQESRMEHSFVVDHVRSVLLG
jgi:hypothetical protein